MMNSQEALVALVLCLASVIIAHGLDREWPDHCSKLAGFFNFQSNPRFYFSHASWKLLVNKPAKENPIIIVVPPDITGIKVAMEGFDIPLGEDRSYVLDSRNQDGIISKIWCIVEGEISVTWYFNENQKNPLQNNTEYQIGKDDIGYYLEILKVSDSIKGHYHCEAENSLGRALSQYVEVSIAYIGSYGKEPNKDVTKNFKEHVMLECHPPDSNPPLNIYWKNGEDTVEMDDRVQIDMTGNLYISDLESSDAGIYKCFVKNTVLGQTIYGEEISIGFGENPTEVPLRGPTLVYKPEATTIGMRTKTLKLQCIAEGNPTPSVRWEKVGSPIRPSIEVDNPVLEISNFDVSDAGLYRCTALNSQDSVTADTNVVIEASPYAGIPMVNKEVEPGETVVFTCDPQGVPEPTFQWYVNGMKPDTEKYKIDGKTITIENVEANDSGVLQCNIDNKYGIYIDQATYKVVYAVPEVTSGPGDVRMVEGKDASLSCEYTGIPSPSITWKYKNSAGVSIFNLTADQIVPDSKYAISNKDGTSVLTVISVSIADDAGEYTCSANNDFGVASGDGTLTVLQKTVITREPSLKKVKAGDSVSLNCQANAYVGATLVITWEDDDGAEVGQGGKFTLENSKLENTGEYTCVASTDLDEARASATIIVQARPGILTRVAAVLDTGNDNTVNIEWEPGPEHNSPITGFIIQAKTSYETDWKEVGTPKANQVTAKVDVDPGNTYLLRMAAVNEIGTSDFKLSNPVDTPVGPPRVNPTNVAGQGSTTDTMTISWDQMDQSQHGGTGFKYLVMWRRTGEEKWMNATIDDYTTTEYLVEGTTTYESFDIKVIAMNDAGKGPLDEEVVIGHAGEAKPGAAPTDVVVTPSPTSIRVNWTAIPKDQENGKILNTKIYVKNGLVVEGTCPVQPTTCVVTGLKPNTDYNVVVRVENSKGQSPASEPVSTTTTEGAPSKVQNFMVTQLSDQMKLTWTEPLKPNGVLQGYTIMYNKINAQVASDKVEMELEPNSNSWIVMNLDPGETYVVEIRAFTNADSGEPVKREFEMRPSGAPTVVVAQLVDVESSDTEISLTWRASTNGPAASEFLVHYKKQGDSRPKMKSQKISAFEDPLNVRLLNLDQGTTYEMTIEAINDDGKSMSKPILTKTSGLAPVTANGSTIQPWLIALICIVFLIVLVLLLLLFIRSQKGGKYNVSDKEDALRQLDLEAAPLKDQNGFNEYSPTDDSCEERDPLKNLESIGHDESDSDSLADYADGNADQFNEDGSFINEYGDNRRKEHDKESSNAAYNTFV